MVLCAVITKLNEIGNINIKLKQFWAHAFGTEITSWTTEIAKARDKQLKTEAKQIVFKVNENETKYMKATRTENQHINCVIQWHAVKGSTASVMIGDTLTAII